VSELREPMDLLAEDAAALDRLAERLVEVGYPLRLERLSASSPTIAALERACRGRASLWVRPQPACPFIALDNSWRDPLAHLNAGRRSDWRRARRRAETLGPVETQILAPRPSELGDLLDLALQVEAKSWKGQAGSALACDDQRASFYRRYAAAASRAGLLRVCFLHIGGQPAAMQLAVQTGGGFWLLKIGYDQRFARCSPGMLLMHDTIAAAVREGLTSYEFLGQAEDWTDVWAPQVHEQVSLHVYPWRAQGLAALTIDGAGWLLRRWRKR
jgi:CelD/BcsL family acetyltransferase involved in cellulose biosynthesis